MTIDEEQFHVYMFQSMIGVDINFCISINAKGGYCWIMLSLMTKGELFIRCRAQRHGSRGSNGHRGSMSDMNSILDQSVSINANGGYC